MAYVRRIGADGILTTYVSGKIQLLDFMEAMNNLLNYTVDSEVYEIVVHHRDVELSLKTNDINRLVHHTRSVLMGLKKGAITFISPSDLIYGICRAIQIQLENERLPMSVFRSEVKGREWLNKIRQQGRCNQQP